MAGKDSKKPEAKETIIKLQIPAGKATPAPPVGPALGGSGVNIMDFVKQFNDRTAKLVWSVVFNHPRLTLFTNKKELENKENGWGRLIARLDILVAQSIIESLRSMVDAEPGTRMVIKNINYPINEGKR